EQLKGAIRNLSKDKNINPNSLLQMSLFEGFLEKLSRSEYQDKFVLKGGLLISSLIGVEMRSTIDMDTTIIGVPVNEANIKKIISEILDIPIDRDIIYTLEDLKPIREKDVYEDFSATIRCQYEKINAILKIDITTGDAITPKEVMYKYPKIFDDGHIDIMAYPVETILAEKFETIISRNVFNTRARDYYDIYMLYKTCEVDKEVLKEAIEKTAKHRNTINEMKEYDEIVDDISSDGKQMELWEQYKKLYAYADGIEFEEILKVVEEIGKIAIR
ncbi:MAG: nucleotidyl transferase AbiEii/AbiGii toxin family protein, partial [Tissierellia bacterium]|nr:nucleotidyl transferase AbiEii/AbiGii toxin family protein [Tissierellia bacterium]